MTLGREKPLPEDFWSGTPASHAINTDESTGPSKRNFIDDYPTAPGVGAEASIWPLYNRYAETYDKEMLETYNGGMDNLLLFAALFSAVVTAFLMLSLPLLQQDNVQANVNGLVAISAQLATLGSANASATPTFAVSDFSLSGSAVCINTLWILSLLISLETSVLAMLIKQWLRAYCIGMPSSSRDRAHHRQFRLDGMHKWSVGHMADSLPVLIHLAVALFFLGLIIYLWGATPALAEFLCVLFSIATIGYVFLAAAPIIYLECPFKSPLTAALDQTWYGVNRGLAWAFSANNQRDQCRPWRWQSFLWTSFKMDDPDNLQRYSPAIFHRPRARSRITAWIGKHETKFNENALAWLARGFPEAEVTTAVAAACFSWEDRVLLEDDTLSELQTGQADPLPALHLGRLRRLRLPLLDQPASSLSWAEMKEALSDLTIATMDLPDNPYLSNRVIWWAWSFPIHAIPQAERLMYYAIMLNSCHASPHDLQLQALWRDLFRKATRSFMSTLHNLSPDLSTFGCSLFLHYLVSRRSDKTHAPKIEVDAVQQVVDRLREPVISFISSSTGLPVEFMHLVVLLWNDINGMKDEDQSDSILGSPARKVSWAAPLVGRPEMKKLLPRLITAKSHTDLEKAAMKYAINEMKIKSPDNLDPYRAFLSIVLWFRSNGYLYPSRDKALEDPATLVTLCPDEMEFLKNSVELIHDRTTAPPYKWPSGIVDLAQLLDVESPWWFEIFTADTVIEGGYTFIDLAETARDGRKHNDAQAILATTTILHMLRNSYRLAPKNSLQALDEWLGALADFALLGVILPHKNRCNLMCEVLLAYLHELDSHACDAITASGVVDLLGHHANDDHWEQLPSLSAFVEEYQTQHARLIPLPRSRPPSIRHGRTFPISRPSATHLHAIAGLVAHRHPSTDRMQTGEAYDTEHIHESGLRPPHSLGQRWKRAASLILTGEHDQDHNGNDDDVSSMETV